MIKSVFIFFSLCLLAFCAKAQFPTNTGQTNGSTQVFYRGGLGADSGFVYRTSYTDTASLNLGFLKNIAGLAVRVGNVIYVRNNTATAWIRQAAYSDIPAQFNPIAGTGISITGTYPNITFTNTAPAITYLAGYGLSLTGTTFRVDSTALRPRLYTAGTGISINTTTGVITNTSIGSQTLQQVFATQGNTAIMTGDNTIDNGTHLFTQTFTSPTNPQQTINVLQNNGLGDYDYQVVSRDESTLGNPTSYIAIAPNKGVTIDNANDMIAGGIHKNIIVNKDSTIIGGFCDACPRVTAIRVDGNDAGNVKFPNAQRVSGGEYVMAVFDTTNRNNLGYMSVPTNSNVGTGFRWAIPNTNNIKTVFNSFALNWDSTSHANGLTPTIDTGLLATIYRVDSAIAVATIPINNLEAAIGANTIDNSNYPQQWKWDALAGNTGLALTANTTDAASNFQKLFTALLSGANSIPSQTTIAGQFSNTHTGSGTNIAGSFSASGGTNNYAILAPSGSVGIGTSTPDSLLTNQLGLWSKRGVRFSGLPTTGTYFKSIGVASDGTLFLKDTAASAGMAITGLITSATAGSVLYAGTGGRLQQSNSDFFYDSTNKRLGISTTSPTAQLTINNAGSMASMDMFGNDGALIRIGYTSGDNDHAKIFRPFGGALVLRNQSGGVTISAGVNDSGTDGIRIAPTTFNVGIGNNSPSYKLDVTGTTHVESNNAQAFGVFNPDITQYAFVVNNEDKWVNVDPSGNGYRMAIGTASPTAQLHTTGDVRFANFGAGAATFDTDGNISSVSDERLKTNINYSRVGLKEIMNLRPINYKWNNKSGMETEHIYTGFSAQNVKANIPNGTGENKDGYLSLQDRAILAAAIVAIQDLKKIIDKQQKEINRLKKKK